MFKKLALLCMAFVLTIIVSAQETPTPSINIPTATVSPVLDQDFWQMLQGYGLQPGDLPQSFVEATPGEPLTLDSFIIQLAERFPEEIDVVRNLETIYKTYEVLGSDETTYFVESCEGQSIFGLTTWIRVVSSPISAELMVVDPLLKTPYEQLFGWAQLEPWPDFPETELPGVLYQAEVSPDMCSVPAVQYIYEYSLDNLVIAASVSAPATTDETLVRGILNDLIDTINSRILAGETEIEPTESMGVPMATFNVPTNVRRGPAVVFNPPIGGFQAGETTEILALNLDGSWLKVRYGVSSGWVAANLTTISGDTSNLPREAGPPLPAPTPVPTAIPPTNPPAQQQPPQATSAPRPTNTQPTECTPPGCFGNNPPPFITATP